MTRGFPRGMVLTRRPPTTCKPTIVWLPEAVNRLGTSWSLAVLQDVHRGMCKEGADSYVDSHCLAGIWVCNSLETRHLVEAQTRPIALGRNTLTHASRAGFARRVNCQMLQPHSFGKRHIPPGTAYTS
jgi:hypothetical protein